MGRCHYSIRLEALPNRKESAPAATRVQDRMVRHRGTYSSYTDTCLNFDNSGPDIFIEQQVLFPRDLAQERQMLTVNF